MKDALLNLNRKLRALHKDLLLFQTKRAEDEDGRRYSPFDILHSSIHDKRFEWLRKLSLLMAQIDHRLHSEEEIEILDVECIYDEASRLFQNQYPDFAEPYNQALQAEPHLYMKQNDVRQALEELQPFAKDMHEMHAQNEKKKFTDDFSI